MKWVLSKACCAGLCGLLLMQALVTRADNVCYLRQQLCNESCAGDTLCRIKTCFKEATECQKREDAMSDVERDAPKIMTEPDVQPMLAKPRRQTLPRPKYYVLPPVETCASLSWQGDRLIKFTASNNCPAAIDADVLFNDGTRVAVFCEGYETCTASFPKVRVSEQFQYWLRYATQE